MSSDSGARGRTLGQRLLAPIAEVRRGESAKALLLALNLLLVLAAYYMLKTVRESLILTEGGAAVKAYSAAGQALLLIGLVPAFGAVASQVNRIQLIRWVTLFFASNVFVFAAASRLGLHIAVPYFLWVGIFNVMVIAQFWAFVNDLYSVEEGKRLFPIVGLGSSLGAWLGSLYAGDVIRSTGPVPLMLVAGAVLIICVVVASLVERRHSGGPARPLAAEPARPLDKTVDGFALIRQQRYLLLIALMTIALNLVNSCGEYLFGRFVVEASVRAYGSAPSSLAARQEFVGGVYAQLFGYVNLVGFLLQLFVVSRVFKYLGVARALFVHPLVVITGYLAIFRAPSVSTMQWLKVFDNSLDYSLGNTTKQALWLPTSRVAKYKAKQAVDSFFMRTGDVLSAGVVFVGQRVALTVPGFAVVNIALTCAWLAIVAALNTAYRATVTGYEASDAENAAAPASPRADSAPWRTPRPAHQTAVPR